MIKIFGAIFAALYFYLHEFKKCSRIFNILFQTGDINILVFRDVFFGRYVQLKRTFSAEKKTSVVESERNYSREAIKV